MWQTIGLFAVFLVETIGVTISVVASHQPAVLQCAWCLLNISNCILLNYSFFDAFCKRLCF